MKEAQEKQKKISVIVPVFNGEKFLPSCLGAIFGSDFTDFEVIVADDCSTDGSVRISGDMGASVVRTPKRGGPAAARNLAAASARGGILLFIDADVVVKPHTISKVASRLDNRPEISALFGSYDDEPGEKNFLSQYKNLHHHFIHQNSNCEAATFWAGLGAVRREVFIAAGGFNPDMFSVPSIEDIELGMRLRSLGHRISLEKDIQAKHLKKWTPWSVIKTDIFCRALPWSKLLVTSGGLINDLNMKASHRVSAVLVMLMFGIVPAIPWFPIMLLPASLLLFAVLLLNRDIFAFFARKRGLWFATSALPWQLFYFLYSSLAFAFCWISYELKTGFNRKHSRGITSAASK